MKIAVMCSGSFTNGLNSPERGEGRWAQNYARMLAMAGHEVYAASMGIPEPRVHYGVNLIHEEEEVKNYGPYDIYIEPAWWDGREPKAKAKKYIALKWSLEGYLREKPFQEDFYLAHPYPCHIFEFTKFQNTERTFALPTMFGTEFPKPNWNAERVFLPGKVNPHIAYKQYIPAIIEFLKKYPIAGCSKSSFQEEFGDQINFNDPKSHWFNLAPYDEVMKYLSTCKLSLPILNPGCIIEAAFCGVPSIFWSHGGFYNPLAEMLDIAVQHDAPPERFTEVAERLMNNKRRYMEATYTIQEYFSPHLYREAIKYFDLMVETIF